MGVVKTVLMDKMSDNFSLGASGIGASTLGEMSHLEAEVAVCVFFALFVFLRIAVEYLWHRRADTKAACRAKCHRQRERMHARKHREGMIDR